MKFVSDLTNKEIGAEIERLCKLGGLQLPEAPKETAEFLRTSFANCYSKLFSVAFDHWIGGNLKTEIYGKVSAATLCKIVKEFLEVHGHKVPIKKRPPAALTEPKKLTPSEELKQKLELYQFYYNLWVEVAILRRKSTFLISTAFKMMDDWIMKTKGYENPPTETEIQAAIHKWKELREQSDAKIQTIGAIVQRRFEKKTVDQDLYQVGRICAHYSKKYNATR